MARFRGGGLRFRLKTQIKIHIQIQIRIEMSSGAGGTGCPASCSRLAPAPAPPALPRVPSGTHRDHVECSDEEQPEQHCATRREQCSEPSPELRNTAGGSTGKLQRRRRRPHGSTPHQMWTWFIASGVMKGTLPAGQLELKNASLSWDERTG